MGIRFKTNTRSKAVISALIITLIYFAFHQIAVLNFLSQFRYGYLIFPSVISLAMIVGALWVLNFSAKGERIFTIVGFAALNTFILAIFLEFLINTQSLVGQITTLVGSLIFVFLISYIILLTVNILNVSYQKDIPLGQAGRAASYIFSLIVLYIAFLVLYSNNISVILRLSTILLITFYFAYSLLWTLKIPVDERITSSLGIAFATSLFALIINLWPVSPEIVALFISLTLYVSLGVALEMKEKISKYVWIEYGSLFIIIFLGLLLISSWGINGHLI